MNCCALSRVVLLDNTQVCRCAVLKFVLECTVFYLRSAQRASECLPKSSARVPFVRRAIQATLEQFSLMRHLSLSHALGGG
jgi:hypothetical protein